VPSRLPSLNGEVIGFALPRLGVNGQGGRLEALSSSLRAGATGIEGRVLMTADKVAVLGQGSTVRAKLRQRRIRGLRSSDLPPGWNSLQSVLELTKGAVPLLLTVEVDNAFEAIITAARSFGRSAEENLWLSHRDPSLLSQWRPGTTAKLINSTRLGRLAEGLERRLALLHQTDINALSMFHHDWSGGTVALAHRFGIMAVGWGAQHERELAAIIDAGIDAVASEEVERMNTVIDEYYR